MILLSRKLSQKLCRRIRTKQDETSGQITTVPLLCKLANRLLHNYNASRVRIRGERLDLLAESEAAPPKTMKMTMTAGPMACAASGEGATDPTASPTEELAKLSSVRMPRNFANLHQPGPLQVSSSPFHDGEMTDHEYCLSTLSQSSCG